jgi:hypothetical protein
LNSSSQLPSRDYSLSRAVLSAVFFGAFDVHSRAVLSAVLSAESFTFSLLVVDSPSPSPSLELTELSKLVVLAVATGARKSRGSGEDAAAIAANRTSRFAAGEGAGRGRGARLVDWGVWRRPWWATGAVHGDAEYERACDSPPATLIPCFSIVVQFAKWTPLRSRIT